MSNVEHFLSIVEGLGLDDGEDQVDVASTEFSPELVDALRGLASAIAPKARRIEGLDQLGRTVQDAMAGIGNVVAAQASIAGELQAALERGQSQANESLERVSALFAARHADVSDRQTLFAEQLAAQVQVQADAMKRLHDNQARLEGVIDALAELIARPRVRRPVRDESGRVIRVVDELG